MNGSVTNDRILGYLARRFSPSEENIASEALTWLLGRSAEARSALLRLAWPEESTVPEDLTFVGQVGNPDFGRPDVVGTDPDNRARLLIEAKFAAGLTPQQPNGYLKLLPTDADSVLLVVAPSARRETLWAELMRAVPQLAPTAPPPSAVPSEGVLRAQVGEHATLALASWRIVVAAVLDALRAADQWALAHDAEQLLGLTEVMDSAAFIPLRTGDLGWRTARQIGHLHFLIDAVRRRIAADSNSLAEPYGNSSSHGRIFYGWYLRSRKSRKAIWYGFTVTAWARHGISPLWARVEAVPPSWSTQRLLHAFSALNKPGQPGLFEDGNSFLIPLEIPRSSGQDEVVISLRSQLESLIARLDDAVPPGETPVADEPDLVDPDEDAGENEQET